MEYSSSLNDFCDTVREVVEKETKAKESNWENNELQFARLLVEIQANVDDLKIGRICDSMDLEPEQVNELLDRATISFEEYKRQHT
jgi:subtilase family serine protease